MTLPRSPAPPQDTGVFAPLRAALEAALVRAARPGLVLRQVQAPSRLAPYAYAVTAEALRGEAELGHGRLVVLHDPDGQQGWQGHTRVVAFVAAEVESEMAADAALAEVGWQWLTESLAGRHAAYLAVSGTVTRTASCRFGEIERAHETSEVEIRAAWTAAPDSAGDLNLGDHLLAWCDLLTATAGLPPAGVAQLIPGTP